MYFPSKKDLWFGLIIWGFVVFLIAAYVFGGEPIGMQFITYNSIAGYILSVLIIGLLLWFWFGTGYKIEGGFIKIKFGPLTSKVKIADITKLSAAKNPLSAPALSIDRIEILYGKYGIALVSPKNRVQFIKTLLGESPGIEVDGALYK
ncbi:hypothetical protein SLU01_35320 [Sporosarcina luteola]|uniref:Uncharacterized protein YyaB-like PH domain-containing protein n=1 Tax=Sporosarcina luteola TaxID=582850 RepID=A0A511ZCP7_9BACL|nr:PH domain-containing protein [Sporosarcina luteola]GEN85220.1 hypothetical protein SLU01_35320 [Sporosarcina luteola]